MPDQTEHEVEVEHLYKVFGPAPERAVELLEEGVSKEDILERTGATVAVHDASFAVRPGETFVVMGLSGSGKSTVLRCLNRLIEPTRGAVHVAGEDVMQMNEKEVRALCKTMSVVFQHFGLLPHRTVQSNVEFGLEVRGVGREERRDKARRAIERVGLDGYEAALPEALSGGMQQRVGLARALANEPRILLMDEPFSALDPLIRTEMQEDLLELQAEMHKTIIFITHDLDEALKIGDRIAIMKAGRIAQVGTPEDILTAPADDYVKSFVQNVDRTRIITAATLMEEPPAEGLDEDAPTVREDTPVAVLLPQVLEADGPLAVVDDEGTVQGVVDRASVLEEVRANMENLRAAGAFGKSAGEDAAKTNGQSPSDEAPAGARAPSGE
jgi:glycine betaine/proline transport system ATP-binding protein